MAISIAQLFNPNNDFTYLDPSIFKLFLKTTLNANTWAHLAMLPKFRKVPISLINVTSQII